MDPHSYPTVVTRISPTADVFGQDKAVWRVSWKKTGKTEKSLDRESEMEELENEGELDAVKLPKVVKEKVETLKQILSGRNSESQD